MSTALLYGCIKYSVWPNLWRHRILSCDMGKINEYNKIVTEIKKKSKNGNQSNFYLNLDLKDGLGIEFTAR